MLVEVKAVGQYKGHNLNENGSVNVSFKFKYDQLVNVIPLTQMLSNDVKISVKLPDAKAVKLGMFRLKSISIDDDGESVVKFNSLVDFVEVNNLNSIVTKESFKLRFVAEIELEEEEGEDG